MKACAANESGNAHGVLKGIGIVNLVYYHAELDRYWIIDYRLFDPERDGKTKLDHVQEMLDAVERRGLQFGTVLMDAWYATVPLMTRIHKAGKLFYCPIKKNRLVDETRGQEPYRGVESLTWTEVEEQQGKLVKVKGFAQDLYLNLFRVVVSPERTDYIITNDVTQSNTDEAQKERGQRWKVEQFHREEKPVTGIERCQCRVNRSQRNHLCAAHVGLAVFQRTGLSNQADGLSTQAQSVVGLFEATTSQSVYRFLLI